MKIKLNLHKNYINITIGRYKSICLDYYVFSFSYLSFALNIRFSRITLINIITASTTQAGLYVPSVSNTAATIGLPIAPPTEAKTRCSNHTQVLKEIIYPEWGLSKTLEAVQLRGFFA